MSRSSYRRHRFPAAVIQQAVWLYFRFPLSPHHALGMRPPAPETILEKRSFGGAAEGG